MTKSPSLTRFLYLTAVALYGSVAHAATCYEYWEAGCTGQVRGMFKDLNGSNCTAETDGTKVWGSSCLTQNYVSFTEMEPVSCNKNYGSVHIASACHYVRTREEDDVDIYMYCTNAGCDKYGKECEEKSITTHAKVQLYERCGGTPVYGDGVPADGQCYALPEASASFRLTCLNDQYVQAEIFHDDRCDYQKIADAAPSFMQVNGGCYQFQGNLLPFAMVVESPCACGDLDTSDEASEVLNFDVVYNLTVSGSKCVEGDNIDTLQRNLAQLTDKEVEIGFLGSALVGQTDGPSYWILYLNVRFSGVRQPDLTAFRDDMDRAVDDGRVRFMVEDTCGGVVDVKVENGGSLITEGNIMETTSSSRGTYSLLQALFFLTGAFVLL